MLSCHDATFLMSQAQERRLSESELTDIDRHLGICTACGHFRKQLPMLGKAARNLARKKDSDAV